MDPRPERYKLVVRQQPLKGRACGFGRKLNPRAIDPTVILELLEWDPSLKEYTSNPDRMEQPCQLVVMASLLSVSSLQNYNYVIHPNSSLSCNASEDGTDRVITHNEKPPLPPPTQPHLASSSHNDDHLSSTATFQICHPIVEFSSLSNTHSKESSKVSSHEVIPSIFGGIVSECHIAYDLDQTKRAFFIFSEICVRVTGTYRLLFTLYDLSCRQGYSNTIHKYRLSSPLTSLCSVQSDPFVTFNSRDFPGVVASSNLSKHLFAQGIKIPIRHRPRLELKRQRQQDSLGRITTLTQGSYPTYGSTPSRH